MGENLRAGLATLELARKLATIRTDISLPLSLEDLKRRAPDVDALRSLYGKLELRTLLKQLDGTSPAGTETAPDAPAASGQPAIVGAPAAAGLSDGAQIIAAAPRSTTPSHHRRSSTSG